MNRDHLLDEVVDAKRLPSKRWLQAKIRAGLVPARKYGRHWVMTDDDIKAMEEGFKNQAKVTELRPAGGLSAASMRRRSA